MSTVPCRRGRQPPTVFVIAAEARSLPTATTGLTPKTTTSSGVISEPPPIPVSPTSVPTPNPKRTMSGSTVPYSTVESAFRLLFLGPAALPAAGGQRAVGAPDRGVTPVVERVVRQLVLVDVGPDLGVAPVSEGIRLPEAVALVVGQLR